LIYNKDLQSVWNIGDYNVTARSFYIDTISGRSQQYVNDFWDDLTENIRASNHFFDFWYNDMGNLMMINAGQYCHNQVAGDCAGYSSKDGSFEVYYAKNNTGAASWNDKLNAVKLGDSFYDAKIDLAILSVALADKSIDDSMTWDDPAKLTSALRELDVSGLSGRLRFYSSGDLKTDFCLRSLHLPEGTIGYNTDVGPCVLQGPLGEYERTGVPVIFQNNQSQIASFFEPKAPAAANVEDVQAETIRFTWSIDPASLRGTELSSTILELLTADSTVLYSMNSSDMSGTANFTGLSPDTIYTLRSTTITQAGKSPVAVSPPFRTLQHSCDVVDICSTHTKCEDGVCICTEQYYRPAEDFATSHSCVYDYVPCTELPCLGDYGTCNQQTGVCDCQSGTTLAALQLASSELTTMEQLTQVYVDEGMVPDEWRLCLPDVASTDEQRKFWAISLWLSAWGLLASIVVTWEFVYNAQLKSPNTMMQGFLAFAVPDAALSFVNFIFFIDALVDGDPLGSVTGKGGRDDAGCLAVAFAMYTLVIMTYFAPVTVALITFLKFNAVAAGKASWYLPSMAVYGICIVFPMIVGAALAGAALATNADDGESSLGSYRGLYCYARRWEVPIVGSSILATFCICAMLTLLLYLATTAKVAKIVKNASGGASSKAPKAIMKRGLLLTATFVFTWIWFVVVGGLSASDQVVNIDIDMVGAIIINAQPIIDAFILLTLPNVRLDYLSRWLKQAGGNVSSSSSSSSSSS